MRQMILEASPFLTDPIGGAPIVRAATWIEAALLGTIATAIAVICVATVGLMMFSGRIDLRRGFVIVLGSFVLFGASAIVHGLRTTPASSVSVEAPASIPPIPKIIPNKREPVL
jgi:type IV secretory pathway VirB2 component (pilin)